MTRYEKQEIDKMPTIAYWSLLGGVELKSIGYGIEDYLIVVANAWFGKRSYHKLKVNYTASGHSYIKLNGITLYTANAIRC